MVYCAAQLSVCQSIRGQMRPAARSVVLVLFLGLVMMMLMRRRGTIEVTMLTKTGRDLAENSLCTKLENLQDMAMTMNADGRSRTLYDIAGDVPEFLSLSRLHHWPCGMMNTRVRGGTIYKGLASPDID